MLRGLYSINHTFVNLTINKVNKLEEYLLAVTRSTLCKQRIARKSNPPPLRLQLQAPPQLFLRFFAYRELLFELWL